MESIVWNDKNEREVMNFISAWLNDQPEVQKGWVNSYYCSVEHSKKKGESIIWVQSVQQKRMFRVKVGTTIKQEILPYGLNWQTRWITTDFDYLANNT